jgi:hypothetical protein
VLSAFSANSAVSITAEIAENAKKDQKCRRRLVPMAESQRDSWAT